MTQFIAAYKTSNPLTQQFKIMPLLEKSWNFFLNMGGGSKWKIHFIHEEFNSKQRNVKNNFRDIYTLVHFCTFDTKNYTLC